MCGFVAVISPAAPVERTLLEAMRDRLAHRGPDGAGFWSAPAGAGGVAFGFRRLAIIDLSHEADQPMRSADGRHVIVFNGEIYNYVELRDELESAGFAFRTRSDTEVLLTAYIHWGTDCLARLNGMFAFAIWDAAREQLFIARDRFGEKPLFMTAWPGGGCVFASEMKAFFAHPAIRPAPDDAVIADYLAGRYYEEGSPTLFQSVERIPAAHAMTLGRDGRMLRRWRYWVPDYAPAQASGEAENVDRFRELFERSVRLRLRSDVPVGTSLSGGLDSSLVVCTMAGVRGTAAHATQNTFSARFDSDPAISEGPQIDAVVQRAGVRAFAVTPDPRELAAESAQLHWHQEEPFLSASIYLQWCVARLARDHDTTVLLDGQGADELLAGYQYYFRSWQLDRADRLQWLTLWRDTVRFSARLRAAQAAIPDGRRRFNAEIAFPFLQALRAARTPPGTGLLDGREGLLPARRGNRLRRLLAEALQYNSLPQLLRYADRNSMAFSREVRLPFLDYDLVEWCTRLPDSALVRDGWQKHILRKAGEGMLPREIQWRADKVGYAAPLDLWLRRELKDWASERLFEGPITGLEAYDRAALESAWREHQAGTRESSWALWRWISLSEWLSLFRGDGWSGTRPCRGAAPAASCAAPARS